MPRVTYTDPPLAAVGLTETEARERLGDGIKVVTLPFGGNDRAIAEGDRRGFGKLIVDAVFNRDYPVVQGVVLVTAVIFVSLSLIADLLYMAINPRLRAA